MAREAIKKASEAETKEKEKKAKRVGVKVDKLTDSPISGHCYFIDELIKQEDLGRVAKRNHRNREAIEYLDKVIEQCPDSSKH